MKKLIFAINLLMVLSTAKAQLFSHLGAGLNKQILSMATDQKGNVAAITPGKKDSLELHIYRKTTNQWSRLNAIKGNELGNSNIVNCFLVNDTIYTFYKNTGDMFRGAVLRATGASVDVIADVYGIYSCQINVNLLGNKMVLTGQFDTIKYNGVNYIIKNQAWLDGNVWKPTAYDDFVSHYESGYPILAIKGDTLGYIKRINNKHYLKRYTLSGYQSNQLVKTSYDTSYLFALPSGFIFAIYNNDTLLNISGNTVKGLKPNKYFRSVSGMAGYDNKVILLSEDKFMYQWNRLTDEVIPIYNFIELYYLYSNRYIKATDKDFILGNSQDIEFNGINYNRVAKINFNSVSGIAYDTIVLMTFLDDNRDTKFNGADTILNLKYHQCMIKNENTGKCLIENIETVPNYFEYKYSKSNVDMGTWGCFRASFSGILKSNNLRPGVTRDTVWFPFFDEKKSEEVSIVGISSPRHRLWVPQSVMFKMKQADCNPKAIAAKLKVLPPPNSQFKSIPPGLKPFTKSGDTLIYAANQIWDESLFNFEVKYDIQYHKIGDTVTFKAWIVPQIPDDPADNYKELKIVLTYSYDPNRKYSIPEGKVTRNLKYVQYHIDFENEGNDYAERVIIKDTLDTRIPVYEFQMMGASHPYTVSLQGKVVTWVFDNINLTPKKQDSVNSKGFVNFIARINSGLREGDSILNRASIYFDYNKPIITNNAIIYFPQGHPGSNTKIKATHSWRIFPNPAEDNINIGNIQKPLSFVVFDAQGRIVWKQIQKTSGRVQIPTTHWSRGIYILLDSDGNTGKFMLR